MAETAYLAGTAIRDERVSDVPRHSLVVRITHWLNAISFIALVVSGIRIILAHPRSYWGETGGLAMRLRTFFCVLSFATATSAIAQKPEEVAYFHLNRVKSGSMAQYETTRKQHWLWHKRLGDTWSYYVWQIVSGETTGAYIVSSFGHTWKEVDESDQLLAGDEDPGGNVEPYLNSESESYYRYRSDLSLAPKVFLPPAKLAVTRVMLKPESVNDFLDGIKKINAAIGKTHYPIAGATRWFQLVTGGESPQFLVLSDRANWAAFAPTTDKGLDAMMEEAYGEAQGASILRAVRVAIRSQYIETWQYRADLSFLPARK